MSDPRSFDGETVVKLLSTYEHGRRNVEFMTELVYADTKDRGSYSRGLGY